MQGTSEPVLNPRYWLTLFAALAMAGLGAWLFLGGGLRQVAQSAVPAQSGEVGQLAPEFSLERPDGTWAKLAEFRGSVVLINFWATWCAPCRAEMPEIEQVYQRNRERGFEVLAVNLQESADEVRPFMTELGLSCPALLDRDGGTSRLYRARAIPSSFVIDRQGTVQYVRIGTLTRDSLEDELRKAGLYRLAVAPVRCCPDLNSNGGRGPFSHRRRDRGRPAWSGKAPGRLGRPRWPARRPAGAG